MFLFVGMFFFQMPYKTRFICQGMLCTQSEYSIQGLESARKYDRLGVSTRLRMTELESTYAVEILLLPCSYENLNYDGTWTQGGQKGSCDDRLITTSFESEARQFRDQIRAYLQNRRLGNPPYSLQLESTRMDVWLPLYFLLVPSFLAMLFWAVHFSVGHVRRERAWIQVRFLYIPVLAYPVRPTPWMLHNAGLFDT